MVMADFFIHDRLQDLWNQINHLHLSYLHTEDSPQKIEQRNKLEGCIRDYLFLSPHKNKFFCPETAEILHRSANSKKDFSGYKAAVGWNAISIYAGNLLSQPWRKEYRQIKTYSGFYKHQIEANLSGAEAIFEAMGYKYMGNGILVMDGPACPDRLTHVSQDSIVAFVECQILKTIWEEVSNVFKISWLEVLEFRETHICSSEQSIRMLNYHYHEKKYRDSQNRPLLINSSGNNNFNNHSPITPHAPPISTMHSFPPHDNNHTHYGIRSAYRDTINPSHNPQYSEVINRHSRTGSSDFGYPQKGLPELNHAHNKISDYRGSDFNLRAPNDLINHTRGISSHTDFQNYTPNTFNGRSGNPELNHAHVGGINQIGHAPMHHHAPMGMVPDMGHAHTHFYGPITSHVQPCHQNSCIYGYPYNFSPMPIGYPRFSYCGGQQVPKFCNGYGCYPNQNFINCPVPTGQLIEVESQNQQQSNGANFDMPDGLKSLRHQNDYFDHKQLAKSTNLDSLTLSKSREDGAGTFESWDYVYRNLESQGYNKDLGERGDLLQEKRKSLKDRKRKSSIELEDAFNSLNLSSGTSNNDIHNLKISEGIKKFSPESISKVPLSNSYDNITQESSRKIPVQNGVGSKNHNAINKKFDKNSPDTKDSKIQNNNKFFDKVFPEKPLDPKKNRTSFSKTENWNCRTCTYINKNNTDICAMCGKSKKLLDNNSIQIGGQECPTCTLVNPKNINFCQACNGSLKDSPTYI